MGAATAADPKTIAVLRQKLANPATTLSQKYRILFSLRNIPGPDAEEAMLLGTGPTSRQAQPRQSACTHLGQLCASAGLQDPSALFRHEVAYCLGQRQDAAAIQTLKNVLADKQEHSMCAKIAHIPVHPTSLYLHSCRQCFMASRPPTYY